MATDPASFSKQAEASPGSPRGAPAGSTTHRSARCVPPGIQPTARHPCATADHPGSGDGLEKQQGIPDFLTHRVQLAERFNLLRNLQPAAGAGRQLRLRPHSCGIADGQRQRRRRFHMLRFVENDGSRTLAVTTEFPPGWSVTTWPVAGLSSYHFPQFPPFIADSPGLHPGRAAPFRHSPSGFSSCAARPWAQCVLRRGVGLRGST